jgi:hypothetical protein
MDAIGGMKGAASWLLGEGMNVMRYEQFERVRHAIDTKPRYETVAAVMQALKVKLVVVR